MRSMIRTGFVLAALFFPVFLRAGKLPETIIKVGLFVKVDSVNLSCQGNYYIFELASGKQTEIAPMNDYLVKPEGNSVVVDGRSFETPLRIVPKDSDATLRLNGRRFRDTIYLRVSKGKITAINELGLEDYLRGILPREASPSWGYESLKVQAVISRTYVLRNLRKHSGSGFDVCTQTHCQVYGGVESEDPVCSKAVEETRAEVLVYDGKLAQTLFHACCGGQTENPNNLWSWESKAPEYLEGRTCKYCRNSPHRQWENKISADLIRKRLVKAGYKVGEIKKIRLSGTNSSGRVKKIIVKHSGGVAEIPSGKFRPAVDNWLVKSTMIDSVEKDGDSFVFQGYGWGHGVGLCQWGAKEMAADGKDYKEILEYYYPGTEVEKWEE